MMKLLMNKLFLSCIKASELIEKTMHVKLSFKEKLQLKVHKMMCDACNNFEKQSLLLEKGIEMLSQKPADDADMEYLKQNIKYHLKNG